MAHNSLKRGFFVGVYRCCIPAIRVVIPASKSVIPAKAGIQLQFKQRATSTTALDTRLRGYDGVEGDAVGWTVSNTVSCALVAVTPVSITTAIPAFKSVIPAKAGIQPQFKQRATSTTALDTRLRGYDGIQWADSVEAGRVGV